ncbi:MAG: hypothetical protein WC523_01045 [Patescibacteria group bacterium]
MLRLNKKNHFLSIGVLVIVLSLFLFSETQAAVSSKIKQVKTKDSPTVYYLDHGVNRKKAYFNSTSYLSYGNKWSDIKVISAAELNTWPEAKLFKTKDSPAIYYIQGAKRVLILNMTDLQDFSLSQEPIITVNSTDLNQYQLASYEEIGLRRVSNLLVFNDLVSNQNNNIFLTNTGGNLAAIFRFRSPTETATITALTLNLKGVYNSNVLETAFVSDADGNNYDANVSLNNGARQIFISFKEPLVFNSGEEKTIEVFLSFKTCACNDQTIGLELTQASDINSSLPVTGNFPLTGTSFKLISGSGILSQVKTQEQTLVGSNLAINSGTRLIGKFTISEESGNEEASIKRIVFRNNGSAFEDDWEDFRLLNNGQLIARDTTGDSHDNIIFNINYLRVADNDPAQLTVLASLKADYRPTATFNLQISGLWGVGQLSNFSLQPTINNLEESYNLN